jgi:putative transcriptional regulator
MRPTKKKPPRPSEILSARLAAGMTQAQAANLIDYSERAWQEWEGGRRRMRWSTLEAFQQRVMALKGLG